jgi:hypothetical protein
MRHQREDVVEILAGNLGHVAAAARLQFDQAFRGENLERLAQRRARDAVLLGELLLIDPGAGRQFMGEDTLAQSFGHFLVKRGWCDTVHDDGVVSRAVPVHCRLASIIMDTVLCGAALCQAGPKRVEF